MLKQLIVSNIESLIDEQIWNDDQARERDGTEWLLNLCDDNH
jgi:hypothetical protein